LGTFQIDYAVLLTALVAGAATAGVATGFAFGV
jgi:hypothetical protein